MINPVGQQYGRLTVRKEIVRAHPKKRRFLCDCACGNTTEIDLGNLRARGTASCGCLSAEVTGDRSRTHGMRSRPEYRVWYSMKQRCHNKDDAAYNNYGGRGIRVCAEWRKSFMAFFEYMGSRPHSGLSVERIKNHLGYEPGNVRWATRGEQARNTRSNVWVEIDGRRQILTDWCHELGIEISGAAKRIKAGMDGAEALAPKYKRRAA